MITAKHLGILVSVWAWLAVWPVLAVPVEQLFTVEVPVPSQAPNQRSLAAGKGLEELLVRLAGTGQVSTDPGVRAALRRAESYLLSYRYQRIEPQAPMAAPVAAATSQPLAGGSWSASSSQLPGIDLGKVLQVQPDAGAVAKTKADTGPQFQLILEFRPDPVQAILRDAGLPLWSRDRPASLVWLVVDDLSQRQLILPADAAGTWSLLSTSMHKHGLPLLEPRGRQMPLALTPNGPSAQEAAGQGSTAQEAARQEAARQEAARQAMPVTTDSDLDADQIWNVDTDAILAASASYGADRVLLVRLLAAGDGQWTSAWELFSTADDRHSGGEQCSAIEACLEAVVAAVAETMSARYRVVGDQLTDSQVQVSVSGLHDFKSYADVLLYWQNLESIKQVQVDSARGDTVVFKLSLAGGIEQLQALVELNRRLQAISESTGSAAGKHLRYLYRVGVESAP